MTKLLPQPRYMPHTCGVQANAQCRRWYANNKERKKVERAWRKQRIENPKTTVAAMIALLKQPEQIHEKMATEANGAS
jgi:hypothetical protein